MTATFTVQNVLNGQISNALAQIFAATGVTYIKRLDLFNTDTGTDSVQIWIQPSGGASEQWRQCSLDSQGSAELLEHGEVLTLAAGDVILAVATNNNVVNWAMAMVNQT